MSNISQVLDPIIDAPESESLTYALLSQQSILAEKPYSEIPNLLLNISSVLVSKYIQNIEDRKGILVNIIQSGIDGILIDLNYDTENNIWLINNQSDEELLNFILSTVDLFVYEKITLENFKYLNILFNVVNKDDIKITDDMLNQLEDIVIQNINQKFIFTEADLDKQSGWPSLAQLLIYMNKQVNFQFVNIDSTNITTNIMSNKYIKFINENNQNYTCPFVQSTDTKVLTYMNSNNYTVDSLNKAIYCGYKTIISTPFEKLNETLKLINSSVVWGWGFNQPVIRDLNYGEYAGFANRFGRGAFYGCASLNLSKAFGNDYNETENLNDYLWWDADDCYQPKRSLCKKPGEPNSWAISSEDTDFFDLKSNSFANSESLGCPDGTLFALPSTPIEMLSMFDYLQTIKNETLINIIKNNGIWIELNAVSFPTCWVVGDHSTACPYLQFINVRNFVKMLNPLVATAVCLLAVGFFLKIKTLFIQNDNKQWKRYTKEISLKGEPDGVPY